MARTVNFDFATAGVASEGRLTMAGTYMTTTGTTINLPPIEQRYLVNGLASIENVIPTPPEADGWRYQVKLETTDGQAHWWIVEVSDLTTPVDFSTLPVIEAISMPIDRTGTMIETWMNSVRAQAAAANANAISALGLGDSNAAESGQIWNSLGVTNSNVSGLGTRLDQADLDLAQHNDRIAANEVDMDILKNTTLPALQAELDSTQSDLSTLQSFTLVNLQNDLSAAEADIATLEGVTLPALQAELDATQVDLTTLSGTTLPALQAELEATGNELTTLQDTTLPALQDDMTAAQADLGTINTRLGSAEADIVAGDTALDARLDQAFIDVGAAQTTADTAVADAAAAQTAADNAQADADQIWSTVKRSYFWAGDTLNGVTVTSGGPMTIVNVPDAPASSSVLRKTGLGGNVYFDGTPLPFDPGALYKVTFKVRVVTAATTPASPVFYAGIHAWNANAAGGPGSKISVAGAVSTSNAHYFAASADPQPPVGEWTTVVGYFQGLAAPGTSGGGERKNITSPGKMVDGTKYITPMILVDYLDGDGVWEIGMVAIDVVPAELQAQVVAAQSAADSAQATADAAQTAAGTAQSTADSALTMAGTKNAVYYSTDVATGTATRDGDLWRQVDSSGDVIGEWQWVSSAWVKRMVTSSAISNLDLGKLTASTAFVSEAVVDKLWAEVITARKILVSQLIVGQGTNMIPWNLQGEGKGIDNIVRYGGSGPDPVWGGTDSVTPGAGNLILNATWVEPGVSTHTWRIFLDPTKTPWPTSGFPVEPGQEYRASAYFKAGGTYPDGTPDMQVSIVWYTGDGTYIVTSASPASPLTFSWNKHEVSATAPATAAYAHVFIRQNRQGNVRLDRPTFEKKADGGLIVNGAITGDHVEANTVAAKVASVISLNADRITSGVINTNRLNASEIAAAVATIINLNADRITAGTINTDRLNANEIAVAIATIISLNADRITSGTINTDRLNANEIAAAVATVISLNADRITAGTLNTARLNATEVAAAVATVINLNADRITSGVINTARLNAAEIAAATAAFQTVNVENLTVSSGSFSTAVIDKLWVDFFATRNITAQYLSIGSFDNLHPDALFNDKPGWGGGYTFGTGDGRYGGDSILIPSGTTQRGSYYGLTQGNRVLLEPGASYRVKVEYRGSSTVPINGVAFYLRLYDAKSGGNASFTTPPNINNSTSTAANEWGTIEGTLTVPAGTTGVWGAPGFYCQSVFTGSARFSNPVITRMSGGNLLVDGAIDGKVITGATVQTSSTTTGVVMDASGIEARVSGTRRFFLNATTGEIEAVGSISTGPSTGARAELKQLSNAGALDFYTEAGTNVPHGSLLTFDTSSVALRRYTDATSFSQYLSLESAATRLNHNSNLRLEMSSTGATLYGNSSSYLRVAIAGSSATLYLRANGSDYFVLGPQSGLGNVVTSVPLYNTTTTAAANMSISVNGVLMRSTSASKYKLYPRTLADDVGEKLLTLEAKDWIDASDSRMVAEAMTPQTASEAADPETELPPLPECRRIPGVIAEEVAAAGLEEFVIYGEDGEIEGVMYDRLGVALIPVVKRQRDRIEALEEEQALMLDRLAQLEAAIAAMNPQP